jgi:hypothetical protein
VDKADDMLWNGSEQDGVSGVRVRKMKASSVKKETVIMIEKD